MQSDELPETVPPAAPEQPKTQPQPLDPPNRRANTLTLTALAVAAWSWFSPRPYVLAIAVLMLIPLVAAQQLVVNRALRPATPDKEQLGDRLALAFGAAACALALRAGVDHIYLDFVGYLIAGGVAGLAVLPLIGGSRGVGTPRLSPWTVRIFGGILVALYVGATLAHINVLFDPSREAVVHRVEVIDKRVQRGRSTSYALELAPYGGSQKGTSVTVPRPLHEAVSVGDDVCVTLHRGALRMRWIVIEACENF